MADYQDNPSLQFAVRAIKEQAVQEALERIDRELYHDSGDEYDVALRDVFTLFNYVPGEGLNG